MDRLHFKYNALLENLREYSKLAVAFSGGVDSTFLVYAAQHALGVENVLVLYALSTLQSKRSVERVRKMRHIDFPAETFYKTLELFPLSWNEFICNSDERCYFCKKRMYSCFKVVMEETGHCFLADGTNMDDLKENRPGLLAIQQLKVVTPFVDIGINKTDIRLLAKNYSLSNHNLPSNSCLATRVQENMTITEQKLRAIEAAEDFLNERGFQGCRVKLYNEITMIEVLTKDIELSVCDANRIQLLHFFRNLELNPVVLSMDGR